MPSQAVSEALSGHWQEPVDRWQASGQSRRAFCKSHDLSYTATPRKPTPYSVHAL